MATTYYFVLDSDRNILGSGLTPDGTVPTGSIVCTQTQAQSPFDWAVVNGEIVPSPNLLANAQAVQSGVLSGACAAQILAAFTSSVLGAANIYASTEVDQRNITQSAQSTKGGLLACQNAAGVWSREPHTQAQSQQVLEDFVTARDAARAKLGTLQAQIEVAATVAAVQAIMWQETAGG